MSDEGVEKPAKVAVKGLEILVTLDRLGLELLVAEKRPMRPADIARQLSAANAGSHEHRAQSPTGEF
jgi:ABC-type enterochelin transport system substrate-binding protein